jgi:hypothetical protein
LFINLHYNEKILKVYLTSLNNCHKDIFLSILKINSEISYIKEDIPMYLYYHFSYIEIIEISKFLDIYDKNTRNFFSSIISNIEK